MSDVKKYAMFGLSVLATLIVYRLVVKQFVPTSFQTLIGV